MLVWQALRLLNNLQLDGNKILVKVDQKTQALLDASDAAAKTSEQGEVAEVTVILHSLLLWPSLSLSLLRALPLLSICPSSRFSTFPCFYPFVVPCLGFV